MQDTDALLEFEGVDKYFGQNHVLKDVDLSVEEREVVVVIGPSGSGKSTLLRCTNRLEEVQDGEIRLDGVSLTDPETDINTLRQRIGMVFQSFNLFPHKTALENIALAPEKVKGWGGGTPQTSSNGSASTDRGRRTRTSCPAASNSGSPSLARWR